MRYTIFNTPVLKTLLLGISLFLLKILGSEKKGDLPDLDKYVVALAPHTSNWDLFYAILIAYALKIDARFMAKKELFRAPFTLSDDVVGKHTRSTERRPATR